MAFSNPKHYRFRVVTGCVAALLCSSALAAVTPPPLPPGSSMVKVQGGLNDVERKRQERAHHHKLHFKKDVTHDDTLDAVMGTQPQGKTTKAMK